MKKINTKSLKKEMTVDSFKKILEDIPFLNIVYFNTNKLQESYKDLTKKNMLLSTTNNSNIGAKIGASIGVLNFEISSEKGNSYNKMLTPKEITSVILDDNLYNTHLLIYKIRLSEICARTRNNAGNIINEKKPVLRLLNNMTPKSLKVRTKSGKNYFEDVYFHLEEQFTYGIIREFLFEDNSFFKTTKPDIDADDFYMVCITDSFSNVRDVSVDPADSKYYLLIEPLMLFRDKN